jgi:DNA-directed RNA polymerase subunit M/transcription elongation factor TFIIS
LEVYQLKACPKCKGAIFIDRDDYGKYLSCVNCGWSKDLAESSQLPRSRIDEEADRPSTPDGCNISPSCFECPLPDCKWDSPNARYAYLKDLKTLAVFQSYQHLGVAHAALATATQLHTTERSIYRMLKRTATTKEEAA